MTLRTFVDKNGNTWEWDETPEVIKAVNKLNKLNKLNPPTVQITDTRKDD
jgi:hypothetical protein